MFSRPSDPTQRIHIQRLQSAPHTVWSLSLLVSLSQTHTHKHTHTHTHRHYTRTRRQTLCLFPLFTRTTLSQRESVKEPVHTGVKSLTRGRPLTFISNFQKFLMKCCQFVICPLCQTRSSRGLFSYGGGQMCALLSKVQFVRWLSVLCLCVYFPPGIFC